MSSSLSQRSRVVQLYKSLLYLGRDYPQGKHFLGHSTINIFLYISNTLGFQLSCSRENSVISRYEIIFLLFPFSTTIVFFNGCWHRPGPEWGTWGDPQELNWFLPLIKPLRRTRTLRYATQRKRRYEANKCGWTQPLFRKARDRGVN